MKPAVVTAYTCDGMHWPAPLKCSKDGCSTVTGSGLRERKLGLLRGTAGSLITKSTSSSVIPDDIPEQGRWGERGVLAGRGARRAAPGSACAAAAKKKADITVKNGF